MLWQASIDWSQIWHYVPAAVVVLLAWVGSSLAGRLVARVARRRTSPQQVMLLTRLVRYGLLFAGIAAGLAMAGLHLGVVLGAAGVLSVAIGFASQASVSQVISGLFLIAERPFVLGDTIQIGGRSGEVVEIGWLAVTLRTFDNLAVRIPNETLIKSEVVNLSRFPIRRLDLQFQVAYRHALTDVERTLRAVADRNPLCLDEPAPAFIVQGYGDSGVNVQFSPWAVRSEFLAMRNSLQAEILPAFTEAGIEIPYPHRVNLAPAESPAGATAKRAARKPRKSK